MMSCRPSWNGDKISEIWLSINAYSLEELFGQISSRSDLKWWSISIFEDGRPKKKKMKNQMTGDVRSIPDLKILMQVLHQTVGSLACVIVSMVRMTNSYIATAVIGCVLFQNLHRSRFVRRDRSSPVKKNTQIFLVIMGVVIWFSHAQSAADHALFYK